MIKKLFLLSLLISFYALAFAQEETATDPTPEEIEKKGILYDREFSIDIRLHTNGLAAGFNYGFIRKHYKTRMIHFQLMEIKHPREVRQTFDYIPNSFDDAPKSFIFGKQNNFYTMHFGYGVKRYYSEKAKKRGVAVGMNYAVGPSLGVLKPYYLRLIRFTNNPPYEIKDEPYTEENAAEFLNPGNIYGASGFAFGLDEVKFMPGAFGQVALHLDWGAFDQFVKALELGITADVHYKNVPVMISEDNRPFFINLYLAIQFGKRW